MNLATEPQFSIASPLDDSWSAQTNPGTKELRVALAAQRDRLIAFSLSGLVAVLANLAGVLDVNYPVSLTLLATGLLSVWFFHYAAKRSFRKTGRVRLVGWWLAFDIAIITAMVPFTGGVSSPWWIWYLTCAGTAALHRGRRSVLAVAGGIAALYAVVLVAQGDVLGVDHGLFLAVSRLVFLAAASAALLLNTIKLRQTGVVIRELRRNAEARADELSRLNGELQDMANLLRDLTLTDAVTGLRNRRYIKERVADAAARSGRRGGAERRAWQAHRESSGFLILGLDNFKAINDMHGHEAGDRVLRHVAQVLRGSVREDDVIARWGDDEFVVMLPHANLGQLGHAADKIGKELRSKPVRLSDRTSQLLMFSIGYAVVDAEAGENGESAWDSALAAAEGALDLAKQDGRNCARAAQPAEAQNVAIAN